jgi:hypothetical protein
MGSASLAKGCCKSPILQFGGLKGRNFAEKGRVRSGVRSVHFCVVLSRTRVETNLLSAKRPSVFGTRFRYFYRDESGICPIAANLRLANNLQRW